MWKFFAGFWTGVKFALILILGAIGCFFILVMMLWIIGHVGMVIGCAIAIILLFGIMGGLDNMGIL